MATSEPFVGWLALWPAATIPPVALRFFREFLAEPSIGGQGRPPRITLAWTILCYLVLIYSAFHPVHQTSWFLVPFGIYVYGGLYRCILELYLEYRQTVSKVARTRIRYLLVGGLVAITLAFTDALPRLGVELPTLGNVLSILYLYFLSQTLFRYRLLDLNELIGKMVVLGTLVVLLWAVYGLLLTWVGQGQEGLFLLNAVVASFVILILFEPVRTRLEDFTNKRLLRQRHELRGSIAELIAELPTAVDIPDVVSRLLSAVEDSHRITHAAVYFINPDSTGYELAGHTGVTRPEDQLDAAQFRVFFDRLRTGYVDQIDVRRQKIQAEINNLSIDYLDATQSGLDAMNASLVAPIFGSAETEQGPWLLGMLGFRDDRVEGAFDQDDIDMFKRLAAQVATSIEATQVYKRVQERERLAAVGEMAAGLAHEIRNPLGAIKGAAQLLVSPDGKSEEVNDTTAEFLGIIVEEVDRLNNVVTQFLDYARPDKNEPADATEVDVNQVLRKTVQLLESYDSFNGINFDIRIDDLAPAVAGDPEQLRQVFLNLGLNALQAMENGGSLEITTSRRRRSPLGYGSFVEIRFRDTGVGIQPDKIKNLFIPFYTTKQRGTGLGLAISQRIVTRHSGTIEVRSSQGKGSTFSVFLPALGPSLPYPSTIRDDEPTLTTTRTKADAKEPTNEQSS